MNAAASSDRDVAGFHRVHAIALPLIAITGLGGLSDLAADRPRYVIPFRLRLSDFRARVSLAVFFLPSRGHSDDPNAAEYGDYFAAGAQGLSVIARQSAEEQGSGLSPVEKVYGSPLSPIPLAGELFGWQVSAGADGKEWAGVLDAGNLPPGHGADGWVYQIEGTWLARATFTAQDVMSDVEWKRVVDRLYLRGPAQTPILPGGRAG